MVGSLCRLGRIVCILYSMRPMVLHWQSCDCEYSTQLNVFTLTRWNVNNPLSRTLFCAFLKLVLLILSLSLYLINNQLHSLVCRQIKFAHFWLGTVHSSSSHNSSFTGFIKYSSITSQCRNFVTLPLEDSLSAIRRIEPHSASDIQHHIHIYIQTANPSDRLVRTLQVFFGPHTYLQCLL